MVVVYNWRCGSVVRRFLGHEREVTKVNCEGIWVEENDVVQEGPRVHNSLQRWLFSKLGEKYWPTLSGCCEDYKMIMCMKPFEHQNVQN